MIKKRVHHFVTSLQVPNADIVTDNLFAMEEAIVHRLVFQNSNNDRQAIIRIGARMLASYFKNKDRLEETSA